MIKSNHYAWTILQNKNSENLDAVVYYADLKDQTSRERFDVLMKEALKCIEDGAGAGDAFCQYYLGSLYYDNGDFVDNDCEKAAFWWNRAAQNGYVKAFYRIGVALLNGEGVDKDAKAILSKTYNYLG